MSTHQFSSLRSPKAALSLCAFALIGLAARPAQAQVTTTILDDNFVAGQAKVQNLPNSSAWYFSKNSQYLNNSTSGSLSANTGVVEPPPSTGDISNLLTYFTPSGSALRLGVGDSLSVGFSFQTERGTGQNGGSIFRVGLYNSGGSRITADGMGQTNTIYNNYKGYTLGMDVFGVAQNNVARAPVRLYDRDKSNGTLSSIGNAHTQVGSAEGSWAIGSSFLNNTAYNGTFIITRNAEDSIIISLLISGNGIGDNYGGSWTVAGGYTDFDTLAFMTGNATTLSGLTLNSVDITYTSPIPEPATVAALIGAAALALCVFKRRR